MLWGGELLRRDGRPVGQVTSAAWGETVGSCVGLAYVPPRRPGRPGTGSAAGRHDVDVAGTAYPVTLSLRAPL